MSEWAGWMRDFKCEIRGRGKKWRLLVLVLVFTATTTTGMVMRVMRVMRGKEGFTYIHNRGRYLDGSYDGCIFAFYVFMFFVFCHIVFVFFRLCWDVEGEGEER